MFGRWHRRVERLEYEIACLRYDLDELRDQTVGPKKSPPAIRSNPRIMARRESRAGE